MDPTHGEILALAGKTSLSQVSDIYENMQAGTMLNPFLAAATSRAGTAPPAWCGTCRKNQLMNSRH